MSSSRSGTISAASLLPENGGAVERPTISAASLLPESQPSTPAPTISAGDLLRQVDPAEPLASADGGQGEAQWSIDARNHIAGLEAKHGPIAPDQKASILHVYRQRAGATLPDATPEQIAQRTAQDNSFAANAGGAFFKNIGNTISGPVGAVAPSVGSSIQHDMDFTYSVDPQSWGAMAGGAGAGILKQAATGQAFPVLAGIETAGNVRNEIHDRRNRGEDISGGQEAFAALGSGAVDAGMNAVGMRYSGVLENAIATKLGAAGIRGLSQGAIEQIAREMFASGAVNAAQGFAGQVGQNLIAQRSYAPERGTLENAGNAAFESGAIGTGGPALRGVARAMAQRKAASVDPHSPSRPAPDNITQQIAQEESFLDQIDPSLTVAAQQKQSPRTFSAAELLPENQQPPSQASQGVRFTTSQGSTYEWDGKTTQRNKSQHMGHETADVGVKPRSSQTVFVDPQIAQEIGMHNSLNSESKPRVSIEGDKIVLTSRYGPGYQQVRRQEFPFTNQPEVGKAPVEFWSNGSNHPGNAITKIEGGTASRPVSQPTQLPKNEQREIDAENRQVAELQAARQRRQQQEALYRQENEDTLAVDEEDRRLASGERVMRSTNNLRESFRPGDEVPAAIDPELRNSPASLYEASRPGNAAGRELSPELSPTISASRLDPYEAELRRLDDRELYWRVRDAGLNAGNREKNIASLLQRRAESQGNQLQANPNLPDWVNEDMLATGKNPNRLLNEIDAARPKTADQLANDKVTKFLEQTDPAMAERAKRGDPSKEEYLAAKKAMQAQAPAEAPSGEIPAGGRTLAPTPANDSMPTAEPASSRAMPAAVKRKAGSFTKTGIENWLLQHHQEMGQSDADVADNAETQHYNPFTFLRDPKTKSGYPKELEMILERAPKERRRMLEQLTLTDNPSESGGADTLAQVGEDRFQQMLLSMGNRNRVERALEFARKSQDPQAQFYAAVHDNLPKYAERRKTESVDPASLPTGSKFKLHGSDFEIIEDADGYRILKDGDDYPAVPVDALDRVPMDKGSLRHATSENSEADLPPVPDDPFAGMGETISAADLLPENQRKPVRQPRTLDESLQRALDVYYSADAKRRSRIQNYVDQKIQGYINESPTREGKLDRIFEILNDRNDRFAAADDARLSKQLDQMANELMTPEEKGVEPETDTPGPADWSSKEFRESNENPRVAAYLDQATDPSSHGYMGWIGSKIAEFKKTNPKAFSGDTLTDHAAFDAFLQTKPAFYEPSVRQSSTGIFGQDVTDSAGIGEQQGMFHEPVDVAPVRKNEFGNFRDEDTPEMFQAKAPAKAEPEPAAEQSRPAEAKPTDNKIAGFRKLAENMQKTIDDKRRPMTQNSTPKRNREYRQRLVESDLLERVQRGFRALADARENGTLPPELEKVTSKTQITDLLRKKMQHNGGYYDPAFETSEYSNQTPAGKALQKMIENKSPQQEKADAERAKAGKIRDLEDKVRFSNIEGFFPTPKPLVERMIDAAGIEPGMKVLEPSAGKGDIADAMREQGAKVDTVEKFQVLQDILKAKEHNVVGDDFLQHTGQYDRIVMNPPFERGQDIDHVQHAWEQLKPGGKLVAIMSEGAFSRSDRKARDFRTWLNERDGVSEKIESGAFQGAGAFRQTGVATRMVEVWKPSASILDKIADAGDAAFKRIQDRNSGRTSAGVDPRDLADAAVTMAGWLAKGVRNTKELYTKLKTDLGNHFGPHFSKIYKQARDIFRGEMTKDDAYERAAAQTVRDATIPRSETVKQSIERNVKGDIGGLIAEGEALRASMLSRSKGAREGYAAGVDQVQGLKKWVANLAKEHLPPESRGKLLDAVANITKPEQMSNAVRLIQQTLSDADANRAIDRVENLSGRLIEVKPTKPVSGDGADDTDYPSQPRTTGAAIRKVNRLELPEDLRGEFDGLRKDAIGLARAIRKNRSDLEYRQTQIDQLAGIGDRMLEIGAEAQARHSSFVLGKRMIRENLVKQLSDTVEPGGAPEGTLSAEPPKDAGLIRRLLGRGSLSMDTITQHLTGSDSGDLHDLTLKQIRRAQDSKSREVRQYVEHIGQALTEAGYRPGSREMSRFIEEPQKVKLDNGREVELTRSNMVGLLATSGDPQTMRLIESDAKWTFASNPLGEAFTLTPDDIERIGKMLTPKERALIPAFKEYNRQILTNRLMQTSINLRGQAPDMHEGYYPRRRNRQQVEDAMPAGWRGEMRKAIENISSLKERAQDLRLPLVVPDFVQDTIRYVSDAAKVIHLAEPTRTASMVWQDPRSKAAIERRYGQSMNDRIDQFLTDTMQNESQVLDKTGQKVADAIARNLSRAWLQLNPSPVLKNILGGTAKLIGEFEGQDLAAGITSTAKSPKETFERMIGESGLAWDRYHGGLYQHYTPLASRRSSPIGSLDFTEALKAGRLGQAIDAIPFMEKADSVPFRVAFAAAERFIERTQPELSGDARQQAILDKFHEAVLRTQNDSSSTSISGLQSSARVNPLLKLGLLFSNDANKGYNMLARMRGGSTRQKVAAVAAIGLNALLASGVGYGLSKGANAIGEAMGGAEESEKDKDRRNAGFIWNLARNTLGTVYGGDQLVSMIQRAASGYKPELGSTAAGEAGNALLGSVYDLAKSIAQISASTSDSPEADKAFDRFKTAMGNVALAGSDVAGLPVSPLARLGGKVVKAATREAEDPRVVERRQAMTEKRAGANALRESLPANVQRMLLEKNRLDAIGEKDLTPGERRRRMGLRRIEAMYQQMLKYRREGRDDRAEQLRKRIVNENAASVESRQ